MLSHPTSATGTLPPCITCCMVGSLEAKPVYPPDFCREPGGQITSRIKNNIYQRVDGLSGRVNDHLAQWNFNGLHCYICNWCGDDTTLWGGGLPRLKSRVESSTNAICLSSWRILVVISSGEGWIPPGLLVQETLHINDYPYGF